MSYAFDLTVNALRKEGLNDEQIVDILGCLCKELELASVNDKFLDRNIKNVLSKIYMPTHIDGYLYWIDALCICKKSRITKLMELYKQIGEKYNSSPAKVERAMRYARTTAFRVCPLQLIKEFLGEKLYDSKKDFNITNKEFLTILLEKI